MGDEATAIILDNGTGMMKAGKAGEEAPEAYFPSVIGRPKYGTMVGTDAKEFYVGKDAIAKRGVCNLTYPVASGVVESWDDMTKVWDHTFYSELRTEPSESPCHLTEAPMNPAKNREKMTSIFFEHFQVPQFYVSIQAVLSLYASGRTTGLVYDSGDGVTHMVPVFDGFSLKHAVKRMNLAGRDLTTYMQEILQDSGINLSSTAEFDIVKEIKEARCYVAQDFEAELKQFETDKSKEVEHTLPDGSVVTIGSQQIRCPEVLFKPDKIGKDFGGTHKATNETIQKCDIDVRRELYENIILSGGSTLYAGLADRLTQEVKNLANASVNVKVVAPNERKFSVWIGGSVLSTLASFQTMWITKAEFEEVGVNIVHRKCF